MGFWSSLRATFGNVFGRKKKEELIEKEETFSSVISAQELPSEDITQEEPEIQTPFDNSQFVTKYPQEITNEEELEKRKIQIEELKNQASKIKKFGSYDEKLSTIVDELGNGRVLKTKKFNSRDAINAGRYDIYRNIIMGALADDAIADKIYKSGLLTNRIMCYIEIKGHIINGKVSNAFSEVLELQNVTPDDLLNNENFPELEHYEGNFKNFLGLIRTLFPHSYSRTWKNVNGKLIAGNLAMQYNTEIKIEEMSVQFDFA